MPVFGTFVCPSCMGHFMVCGIKIKKGEWERRETGQAGNVTERSKYVTGKNAPDKPGQKKEKKAKRQ